MDVAIDFVSEFDSIKVAILWEGNDSNGETIFKMFLALTSLA